MGILFTFIFFIYIADRLEANAEVIAEALRVKDFNRFIYLCGTNITKWIFAEEIQRKKKLKFTKDGDIDVDLGQFFIVMFGLFFLLISYFYIHKSFRFIDLCCNDIIEKI